MEKRGDGIMKRTSRRMWRRRRERAIIRKRGKKEGMDKG